MTEKELLERAADAHKAAQPIQPIDSLWHTVDKDDRVVYSDLTFNMGDDNDD